MVRYELFIYFSFFFFSILSFSPFWNLFWPEVWVLWGWGWVLVSSIDIFVMLRRSPCGKVCVLKAMVSSCMNIFVFSLRKGCDFMSGILSMGL